MVKKKKFTLGQIERLGNKIIQECVDARRIARENGDFRRIKSWDRKGIYIQDDDAELIDAEGFWKYLLKRLGEGAVW